MKRFLSYFRGVSQVAKQADGDARVINYFVKDAPVARKIQIAFGVLITMVAVGVGYLVYQAKTVESNVTEYRQAARLSEAVGVSATTFQEMRVHALRFEQSGNPSEITKLNSLKSELADSIKNAQERTADTQINTKLSEILATANDYAALSAQAKVDPSAITRRNTLGPKISDLSDQIMTATSARQAVLGPQMMKVLSDSVNAAIATIVGVIVFGGIFAVVLANIIATPFARTTAMMEDVAAGNIDQVVDDTDRKDCVGRLRNALSVFINNALEMRRLEADAKSNEATAELTKRRTMDDLASQFETSVAHVVETLASAATELEATSETLNRTAEDTSNHSHSVARTADMSAHNVQTVAAASEEMSASISGISQQVNQAAQIAKSAEVKAAQTNTTVVALSAAAGKIGAVVSLISDIASQTNLLALNATIEAARAGEAGKGFAVVASEVKSLAEQTAKATDEISAQIGGVQIATQEAVQAIEGISATISEISQISASISVSVEEQMGAVREISRSSSDVAAATSEVSQAIGLVQQGSTETGAAAQQSLAAARELGQQAITLKREVDNFLIRVRAA
jgi:methyl-accepting chemotaxis protein